MTKTGRILLTGLTGTLLALGFAACGDDDDGTGTTGGGAQGPSGCEGAIAADDPSTVTGDTRGRQHTAEGSCLIGAGPEVIYQVTPALTGMLDLTLESAEDLGLYARSACDDAAAELGCADLEVQGGTENLRVPVTAGQPVWVFVDGYNPDQAGSFTLSIASRAITCGDGQVEGSEECDPPDMVTCTAECTRIPEICDDGQDNDVDQLVDCEDAADCGSNAACPLAMVCGAAAPVNQQSTAGDTSGAQGLFAGSCTGGALSPEALLAYTPQQTGALLLTLQSATDQGLYVRTDCADAATELGCLDDVAGGVDETLVVPVEQGTTVTVFVDAADPAQAGPFTVFNAIEPSTEVEPNETTANASATSQQGNVGAINPPGDVDVYEVTLMGQDTSITAEIQDFGNADCANFKVDSFVELLGPDGTTSVATNDDTGNFCSRVEATGLAAGTYFIRVLASENAMDPTFAYRLAVTTN